jgi:exonuclease III
MQHSLGHSSPHTECCLAHVASPCPNETELRTEHFGSSTLNILHYNIRSLRNKFEELSIILEKTFNDGNSGQIDVICLSETWLNRHENITLPGYNLKSSYARVEGHGGGIAVFVRQEIPCMEFQIQNVGVEGFEAAAVVLGENNPLLVVCVYRPPQTKVDSFLHQTELILTTAASRFTNIIVGGDFNIDFTIRTSRDATKLIAMMQSFGLNDTITSPTRVTATSATIIDNFFVNFDKSLCHAINFDVGLSDHYAQIIYVLPPVNVKNNMKARFIIRRLISDSSKKMFSKYLTTSNWDDIYSTDNTEIKFEIFMAIFRYGFNSFFPIKRKKIKDTRKTFRWQSTELQSLCIYKRDLELLIKSTSDNGPLKLKHKLLKHEIKSKINQLRANHARTILGSSNNKTKSMWKIINNEVKNCKESITIYPIQRNGENITSHIDIANEFNNFFTNPLIGDSLLPLFSGSPVRTESQSYDGPALCDFQYCDANKVRRAVDSMKNKMSAGVDEIPAALFKEFFPLISEVITHLFNHSLKSGLFPSCLKYAKIIPIYIKGTKSLISNYRPIALLTCISKVLEKLAFGDILHHLERNKILCASQFGFRKNKSSVEAVTNYVNAALLELDKKNKAMGVFMDLQKAFDCVDHSLLIRKLESCGISGTVLRWLDSYLQDRYQFVEVSGLSGQCLNAKFSSKTSKKIVGVPQGSVLGPLLFLIYINDLPRHVDVQFISLFADDSSFLVSGRNSEILFADCQRLLDDLSRWCCENRLVINVEKSSYTKFNLSRRGMNQRRSLSHAEPRILGSVLEEVEDVCFLGINVDSCFDWTKHVVMVCGKLRRSQFVFFRLQKFLSLEMLMICYHAYVESVLRYGIILWGASSQITKAFRAQKSILRIMTGRRPRDTCRGLFRKNKILTLTCIYILELGSYAFRNHKSWQTGEDTHDHFTRHNRLVRLEIHRTTSYESAPLYASKLVYNKIPGCIRNLEKYSEFKAKLTEWLCEREFYCIREFFAGE